MFRTLILRLLGVFTLAAMAPWVIVSFVKLAGSEPLVNSAEQNANALLMQAIMLVLGFFFLIPGPADRLILRTVGIRYFLRPLVLAIAMVTFVMSMGSVIGNPGPYGELARYLPIILFILPIGLFLVCLMPYGPRWARRAPQARQYVPDAYVQVQNRRYQPDPQPVLEVETSRRMTVWEKLIILPSLPILFLGYYGYNEAQFIPNQEVVQAFQDARYLIAAYLFLACAILGLRGMDSGARQRMPFLFRWMPVRLMMFLFGGVLAWAAVEIGPAALARGVPGAHSLVVSGTAGTMDVQVVERGKEIARRACNRQLIVKPSEWPSGAVTICDVPHQQWANARPVDQIVLTGDRTPHGFRYRW